MRRISSAAVMCLLVAMQGCTINIPTNLLNGLTVAGSPKPTDSASACAWRFESFDRDRDGFVTWAEYNGLADNAVPPADGPGLQADADNDGRLSLAEFSTMCNGGDKPTPRPKPSRIPGGDVVVASGAFFGMANCDHAFKKFDTDRDERLSPGEYAVWQMGFQSPIQPAVCAEPPVAASNAGTGYVVLRAPAVFPSPSVEPVCAPPRPMAVLPPFEKWDRDRDQFIDRAELCEAASIVPPTQPPRPVCEDTFKHIDRNADGAISPEEYFVGDFAPPLPDGMSKPGVMPSEGELAARFKGLDANADGRLDPREYCADWGNMTLASPDPAPHWDDCYAMVKSYDRNQDGQVTWEEYYEGFLMPLSARYDGQKDEIYSRFKGLDRNGDGVLTPDEYCPPDAGPTATPTPSETARPDDANR
jgi:Ca2+-binding EF-hand superfamily protein